MPWVPLGRTKPQKRTKAVSPGCKGGKGKPGRGLTTATKMLAAFVFLWNERARVSGKKGKEGVWPARVSKKKRGSGGFGCCTPARSGERHSGGDLDVMTRRKDEAEKSYSVGV